MPNVKTAVSIPQALFRRADTAARRLRLSRSALFALSLERWLHQQETRHLVDQLNAVHRPPPDAEDRELFRRHRRKHRRLLERE